ncbi:MAG: YbcC family protein [Planctomycetaceae bacterium]
MSTAELLETSAGLSNDQLQQASLHSRVTEALESVHKLIAPVWPLSDFVAVNPYLGLSDQHFLQARASLQTVSTCETLMPLEYYKKAFLAGLFTIEDVRSARAAVLDNSSVGNFVSGFEQLEALLSSAQHDSTTKHRPIATYAGLIDSGTKREWEETIVDFVSGACGEYYDQGQATWKSPWQDLTLFEAWRTQAIVNRRPEIEGIAGFREFAKRLPTGGESAIEFLIGRIGIPKAVYEQFLAAQAMSVKGWCAWTKYQSEQFPRDAGSDLTDLIAIRLAYDVALAGSKSFKMDWAAIEEQCAVQPLIAVDDESRVADRYVLQRATEHAFRRNLLGQFSPSDANVEGKSSDRKLAQLAFCIDVRSERIRRHLEAVSEDVGTIGFAGFFGAAFKLARFGESTTAPHAPALLSPELVVCESVRGADEQQAAEWKRQRGFKRSVRSAVKSFQRSAVSCFGFVESAGLLFGPALLGRTLLGSKVSQKHLTDGVPSQHAHNLAPSFEGLEEQGFGFEQQTDLAEGILRGMSLTSDFAKLVVLCGHTTEAENNPARAGLECGACCGHSGEPSARFVAELLNKDSIREAVRGRGIEIPADTVFVAGLHKTTTDDIEFFDTHLLPPEQMKFLEELRLITAEASNRTREERLPSLRGNNINDLRKRATDWSEIRPEWGLAGNAAFVVGPRRLTATGDLEGRSFLHSYNWRSDKDYAVLEQIITAPMVVAHWINMQYYASTVDPTNFGSGTKTIHNVVGQFGLLSGNAGDLQTGLPLQCVHNGEDFQHEPLRLLCVIEAPTHAIAEIIDKHQVLRDLVENDWLHLVAVDDAEYHEWTSTGWQAISTQTADLEMASA